MTPISAGNGFAEFLREETEQPISQRFEKQVRKYPRNIAIKTNRDQLNYIDLNALANRIARVLVQQFRDDTPVAILMDHDAPAVVAILSALKAAKSFFCLDPALPQARIKQILSDAGSDSIITNDQYLNSGINSLENCRHVVNVDHCDASINDNNLDLKIYPDSIAYILYTSGSTGNPKGVMRTHRIDLRNIRHVTNSLCITSDDRITLLGSYSTGQGITDIFCALLNGATLFPRNIKTEGLNRLADWLVQERITFYHSAATVFRHFTHCLSGQEVFPDLRIVRLGAEAVSWRDVESYKKHFSDSCILANVLSCSEASTYSQFLVNKETEINEIVPVGYPVEDKEILILDERGEQLGPAEIGEIAVRSRFLSPGYWKRPDLTNLSFNQDKDHPEYRIYRTGDLGRQSSDGCLEHLGRRDAQVKIRGYRVECREIELALLRDPAVDEAFVTHGQDAQEGTYLIAYIVCRGSVNPSVSELRSNLAQRLPSFMVPTAFVFLDTLPLTVTGKIDRSALPKPVSTRPPLDASYVSPQGPIGKSVAEICSEILNISTIGVHDNLFDLGGHSVSAMQIVNRVMKTFQVDIPLKCFYDSPTIAGLSALIESSHNVAEAKGALLSQNLNIAPSLRVVSREGPILPSIAQELMLRLERMFPGLHQFNVPAAFRLRGPLNLVALKQGLALLVDRHESLRTVFPEEDGKHYQHIVGAVSSELNFVDLHGLPGSERELKARQLFREESQRPFDLARGPLFRVTIFRLSDDDHILAVTLHQALTDGWSIGIFVRDLAEFYRSILQGNRSQLPDLPVQYVDFATSQREALEAGLMDGQLIYWKSQLSEPVTPLEFRTDAVQRDETSFFTARKEISISGKLYQSVKSLAREEKTTPYIVLLTALNILLSGYFDQKDIRVATLVANRHRSELENLVGHFVNTVILRAKISEDLAFKQFAQLIKEVTLSAHSNQDIPFEVLLQSLENDSTIRSDMLSPVLFIFQGEAQPVILPDLTLSALDDFQNTATPEVSLINFDVVLSVKERAEGLTGFVVYKIFVFEEMMISNFMRNFETLLERIVHDPDQSVFALRSSIEF